MPNKKLKHKWALSALAGVVLSFVLHFIISRSDKIAAAIGAAVVFLAQVNPSALASYVGIATCIGSFALSWFYQSKRTKMLKQKIDGGEAIEELIDEE